MVSTDPRFIPVIDPARASHQKFWPFGPFISITLAQWALESDYGTRQSGKNNFFGIKANPIQIHMGIATKVWTKEYVNGRYYSEALYFADYPDVESGFDAHAQLLVSHHYLLCMRAADPETYANALQQCGYATAPDYADILISIINSNSLTDLDQRF
jgi:flagellum-specific peptidoglycan hydrolase FlgJ